MGFKRNAAWLKNRGFLMLATYRDGCGSLIELDQISYYEDAKLVEEFICEKNGWDVEEYWDFLEFEYNGFKYCKYHPEHYQQMQREMKKDKEGRFFERVISKLKDK